MSDLDTTVPEDADERSARRSKLGVRVFLVVAVLFVVFGVIFSTRFGTDPTLVDSPLIGTQMREVTLPLLEHDGEVGLHDQRGDILVVNFWASWCLPCRSEHPALVFAASEFAEVDVRFIGVLSQDARSNGIAFLDELGRGEPFTYAWDERSRAALAFGTLGLPETFFIDRDGVIAAKITGPVSRDLLVNTINELLLGRSVGEIKTGEVENRG
jgi:cytochrome c biogenesis protein CcmG/thiol:disulfide interchange protein DsbE